MSRRLKPGYKKTEEDAQDMIETLEPARAP